MENRGEVNSLQYKLALPVCPDRETKLFISNVWSPNIVPNIVDILLHNILIFRVV